MKKFIFIKALLVFIFALNGLQIFGQANDLIPLPSENISTNEFRFAAIGDTGTGGKNQRKLAEQMTKIQTKTNFKLLLFLGDNIYENGSPKGIEDKFLKPYTELFENGVEFRGVIGNHDVRSKHGTILQQLIFNMGHKTFYSFNKKDDLVEFYGIDSTIFAKEKRQNESQAQIKWLENELKQSKAKWKIAFLHHTIYSSAKRHGYQASSKDRFRVRNALEPLYQKYGVNISLNGHDHVYERSKPQNGITYFTSGAGAKLRKGNLQKESPYFAFGNDQVRSFMLFSVKPNSITFWAIGIEGNILDSGVIEK